MDTGDPISYLVLEPGTPVYAADETQIGTVHEVLADAGEDVFDGIVVDTAGGRRFADADQCDRLYERAAILKLSADEARSLPEHTPGPAVIAVGADDLSKSNLKTDVRAERNAAGVWKSSIGDVVRGWFGRRPR
jgi:hypothetical protein